MSKLQQFEALYHHMGTANKKKVAMVLFAETIVASDIEELAVDFQKRVLGPSLTPNCYTFLLECFGALRQVNAPLANLLTRTAITDSFLRAIVHAIDRDQPRRFRWYSIGLLAEMSTISTLASRFAAMPSLLLALISNVCSTIQDMSFEELKQAPERELPWVLLNTVLGSVQVRHRGEVVQIFYDTDFVASTRRVSLADGFDMSALMALLASTKNSVFGFATTVFLSFMAENSQRYAAELKQTSRKVLEQIGSSHDLLKQLVARIIAKNYANAPRLFPCSEAIAVLSNNCLCQVPHIDAATLKAAIKSMKSSLANPLGDNQPKFVALSLGPTHINTIKFAIFLLKKWPKLRALSDSQRLNNFVRYYISNPCLSLEKERTVNVAKHLEAQIGVVCAQCHEKSMGENQMKVCGKCRRVRYCDGECQKKHWKTHKLNCRERRES